MWVHLIRLKCKTDISGEIFNLCGCIRLRYKTYYCCKYINHLVGILLSAGIVEQKPT